MVIEDGVQTADHLADGGLPRFAFRENGNAEEVAVDLDSLQWVIGIGRGHFQAEERTEASGSLQSGPAERADAIIHDASERVHAGIGTSATIAPPPPPPPPVGGRAATRASGPH